MIICILQILTEIGYPGLSQYTQRNHKGGYNQQAAGRERKMSVIRAASGGKRARSQGVASQRCKRMNRFSHGPQKGTQVP